MERYIKLTATEANSIGFYRISRWLAIIAKECELKDGKYALPVSVIGSLLELKKSLKIKGVDLGEKSKVTLKESDFKIIK